MLHIVFHNLVGPTLLHRNLIAQIASKNIINLVPASLSFKIVEQA